jgi:plasmid stabilization system protein ParE
MSAPMRALTTAGRGLLTRRYLSVYRRSSTADLSRVADWIVVRAAARFWEGIEAEYEALAHVIDQHRRRAGHE